MCEKLTPFILQQKVRRSWEKDMISVSGAGVEQEQEWMCLYTPLNIKNLV
jgi:hypothetical protein